MLKEHTVLLKLFTLAFFTLTVMTQLKRMLYWSVVRVCVHSEKWWFNCVVKHH